MHLFFFSTSNVGEFSVDVRMLAALQEDKKSGNNLLDAAKKLAGAFTDLLNAAQPGARDVSRILEFKLSDFSFKLR